MKRFLMVTAFVAALPLVGHAQTVQSLMNIQYWHACSNPEFPAAFGFDVIVVSQATRTERGDGPNVTCNLLEVDLQGSINLGCSRAAMLSQSWGLLDYSLTPPLQPLPCG